MTLPEITTIPLETLISASTYGVDIWLLSVEAARAKYVDDFKKLHQGRIKQYGNTLIEYARRIPEQTIGSWVLRHEIDLVTLFNQLTSEMNPDKTVILSDYHTELLNEFTANDIISAERWYEHFLNTLLSITNTGTPGRTAIEEALYEITPVLGMYQKAFPQAFEADTLPFPSPLRPEKGLW